MINSNVSWIQRIQRVSIVFLAFFLFGCGTRATNRPAQPVSATAIAAGNVENGRKLFMGYAHFQNDGPPCMGCHSVGNNGLLGGGAMGPDLTDVSTRLSQDEIASILTNSGSALSPVMPHLYRTSPDRKRAGRSDRVHQRLGWTARIQQGDLGLRHQPGGVRGGGGSAWIYIPRTLA